MTWIYNTPSTPWSHGGPGGKGTILMECHALHADLHKLGGIEVLLDSLGEHNSKALRAAGANALGVAASNNEEFVQRFWEMCGRDILDKLLQVRSRPSK